MFFVALPVMNGCMSGCISGPFSDNPREPEGTLEQAEVEVRRGGTEVPGGSEEEPEVKAGRGGGWREKQARRFCGRF